MKDNRGWCFAFLSNNFSAKIETKSLSPEILQVIYNDEDLHMIPATMTDTAEKKK